jgi:hypothetical protein
MSAKRTKGSYCSSFTYGTRQDVKHHHLLLSQGVRNNFLPPSVLGGVSAQFLGTNRLHFRAVLTHQTAAANCMPTQEKIHNLVTDDDGHSRLCDRIVRTIKQPITSE